MTNNQAYEKKYKLNEIFIYSCSLINSFFKKTELNFLVEIVLWPIKKSEKIYRKSF